MNETKRTTLSDIPSFMLEQAVLGELPASQQQEIEAMDGFAEYRARLQADNESILSDYPTSAQVAAIRSRASQASSLAWKPELSISRPNPAKAFIRVSAFAVPLAAAALFTLMLLQPGREMAGVSDPTLDATRVKGVAVPDGSAEALAASRSQHLSRLRAQAGLGTPGNAAEALTISVRSAKELLRSVLNEGPQLEIWRQVDGKAEVLKPGASVRAFDNLQIAYLAAGRPYGMIVSLDGRGRFTLHYPESFNTVPVLDQGTPTVLDFAYQLDDAPKFERFFFITSQTQFTVNTIWALLEKQLGGANVAASWAVEAIPNLPAGFDVSSFLLNK